MKLRQSMLRTLLVAALSPEDDVLFIGNDRSPIRMRSSGRLSVGIKDDFLGDNSGSFRVIGYY